ncbi:MAG: hypothetical protein ACOC7P_00220 [Chloroflexota bacterium]
MRAEDIRKIFKILPVSLTIVALVITLSWHFKEDTETYKFIVYAYSILFIVYFFYYLLAGAIPKLRSRITGHDGALALVLFAGGLLFSISFSKDTAAELLGNWDANTAALGLAFFAFALALSSSGKQSDTAMTNDNPPLKSEELHEQMGELKQMLQRHEMTLRKQIPPKPYKCTNYVSIASISAALVLVLLFGLRLKRPKSHNRMEHSTRSFS